MREEEEEVVIAKKKNVSTFHRLGAERTRGGISGREEGRERCFMALSCGWSEP